MNTAIYYPEERKELLMKAGLIVNKKVEIRAYVSKEKHPLNKNQHLVDYRNAKENLAGTYKPNSNQIYKWSDGLTQEEKRIIHEECGVPYHDLDTRFMLKHGLVLDLNIPADCAIWRFIEHNPILGRSEEECKNGFKRFYIYDAIKLTGQRAANRSLMINALELYQKLNVLQMSECLGLLGIDASTMSEHDIRDLFGQECETNYKKVLELWNAEDKEHRVMLNNLIFHGILTIDPEKKTIMRKGSPFASDKDAALLLISDKDNATLLKGLMAELKGKVKPQTKQSRPRNTIKKS
jgi:hypothetical protein